MVIAPLSAPLAPLRAGSPPLTLRQRVPWAGFPGRPDKAAGGPQGPHQAHARPGRAS